MDSTHPLPPSKNTKNEFLHLGSVEAVFSILYSISHRHLV